MPLRPTPLAVALTPSAPVGRVGANTDAPMAPSMPTPEVELALAKMPTLALTESVKTDVPDPS